MKRQTVFFAAFFSLVISAAPSFAEVHGEREGLFWLDVPDGWLWTQEKGQVTVSELDGSGKILIRYEKVEGFVGSGRDLVFEARDDRRREVAGRRGKSVMKVERRIDGVFALQTGFLILTRGGMWQATSFVFFHKGYLFDVYFEAPREIFRLEMEKIVDTWRFEKPEEPEEESGTKQPDSLVLL